MLLAIDGVGAADHSACGPLFSRLSRLGKDRSDG